MRQTILAALLLSVLAGAAQAAPLLGNQTQLSFSAANGTRIEYLAADGRAWRWHSGQARVVSGGWRFEEADICFRYGTTDSAAWRCVPYELYRLTVVESRSGDVFRLRDRQQVPFTLPRQRLSIADLLTRG
ncbi:MAG: hypothetical protein IPK28_08815 [Devosia sp.]|nr:hypothetical protein [Devosia sp.]